MFDGGFVQFVVYLQTGDNVFCRSFLIFRHWSTDHNEYHHTDSISLVQPPFMLELHSMVVPITLSVLFICSRYCREGVISLVKIQVGYILHNVGESRLNLGGASHSDLKECSRFSPDFFLFGGEIFK